MKSYRKLLLYTSAFSVASGIFSPLYLVIIQKIGGVEVFGVALGLIVFAEGLTALSLGKYSDKYGDKTLLLFLSPLLAIGILLYTLVSTPLELYVLQLFNGALLSLQQTTSMSYLGRVADNLTQGKQTGTWYGSRSMIVALGMISSGYLASLFGVDVVIYLSAAITLFSVILLV